MSPMTRNPIRVLAAEGSAATRKTIAQALDDTGDTCVAGECTPDEDALKICVDLRPDVVLIDLDATEPSGASLIGRISSEAPDTAILVFTMIDSEAAMFQAIAAGACGYLLKTANPEEILDAVRTVHAGELYLGQRRTAQFVRDFMEHVRSTNNDDPLQGLTPRERELLPLLADGGTDAEIGLFLNLSPHTVKTHRKRIMEKLDVHSKVELVRFAMRRGIIR